MATTTIDPQSGPPSGPPESDLAGGRVLTAAAPTKTTFKFKLSDQGHRPLGYLGLVSDGIIRGTYGILSRNAANAATFESYPYGGAIYYQVRANGPWLGITGNAYTTLLSEWFQAQSWTHDRDTKKLVCAKNAQALSIYDLEERHRYQGDGPPYLYCWDEYHILRVDFDYES